MTRGDHSKQKSPQKRLHYTHLIRGYEYGYFKLLCLLDHHAQGYEAEPYSKVISR